MSASNVPPEWDENVIRESLATKDEWVERGILAIYAKQTQDEKAVRETIVHNSVGFSSVHAHLGSYYAKWLLGGKHLSGKHLAKGRKLVLHYTKQLTKIANKEV
jgi:hypothetical protein